MNVRIFGRKCSLSAHPNSTGDTSSDFGLKGRFCQPRPEAGDQVPSTATVSTLKGSFRIDTRERPLQGRITAVGRPLTPA
jgi:hypothetical protein